MRAALIAVSFALASIVHAQSPEKAPPRPSAQSPEWPKQAVQTMADLRPDSALRRVQAGLWDRPNGLTIEPGWFENRIAMEQEPWTPIVATPEILAELKRLPPVPPPPTPEELLRQRVCREAAVLVGHGAGRRAFLTTSETSMFTVMDIQVDRWIHPSDGARTIEVAIEGGDVYVAGKRTIVFDTQLPAMGAHVFFLETADVREAGLVLSHSPKRIGSDATADTVYLRDLADAARHCR